MSDEVFIRGLREGGDHLFELTGELLLSGGEATVGSCGRG